MAGNKNQNNRRMRPEREKSEFDNKVLEVARVTRVMGGGKRFKFRALVIIGDRKGRVGMGLGKGTDVAQSVEKAINKAKKHLITVPIKNDSIPHEISAKYGTAKVFLRPGIKGKGLVAGGAMRVICDLAGLKNVTAKIFSRSNNKINISRATLEALKSLKTK